MVPSAYDAYLAAVATAAAALIGLLFVAVSVRDDSIFGPKAIPGGEALAITAFTGLVNSFVVSVLGLIPKVNIGEPAVVMAVIGIVATVRLQRRLHTARNLIVLAVTLLAYAAQFGYGVLRIPLGALQEREFRLFFTRQSVSLLGDAVTLFALVWAVLDLTGSARDLGFVIAAKTAPLVIFLLVGGVFADRLPRRGVMVTADITRIGIQAATAALLLSHTARVWELIVLQALAGAATAFFNPASTGLTPMTVSAERLQEANALRGKSMAATQLAGPALAGILIVTVGPGYALALDAASFAVGAFCLARLHLPVHVNLPPCLCT